MAMRPFRCRIWSWRDYYRDWFLVIPGPLSMSHRPGSTYPYCYRCFGGQSFQGAGKSCFLLLSLIYFYLPFSPLFHCSVYIMYVLTLLYI
jgi:hypothetical protein